MHYCIRTFTENFKRLVLSFLYEMKFLSINPLQFNNSQLMLVLNTSSQFAKSDNSNTIYTYTITMPETKKIKKQKNQNNN